MRKLFFIVLMLLLVSPLHAEDFVFKSLQVSQLGLSFADLVITNVGLKYGAVEGNPLAKWYIEKPILAVSINLSANLLLTWCTSELYKKDKSFGIVMVVVINVIRVYVVYHNLRVLKELK